MAMALAQRQTVTKKKALHTGVRTGQGGHC